MEFAHWLRAVIDEVLANEHVTVGMSLYTICGQSMTQLMLSAQIVFVVLYDINPCATL